MKTGVAGEFKASGESFPTAHGSDSASEQSQRLKFLREQLSRMSLFQAVVLTLVFLAGSAVSQTTVHKLAFRSDVQFRFATTEVACIMSNDGEEAKELTFDITLPKQAFITNFSMEIEGKVYPGNVKEKQEAREQYRQALQHGHTGGLVEQKPRHSNQFEVAVNIAAGHNVTFTLLYQELLRRRFGKYEHAVHIDDKTDVKELSIEVFISERSEIKNVRTPVMRKDIISNAVKEDEINTLTEISLPTPTTAHVVYRPTPKQVKEQGGGWFTVQYDVKSDNAGEIMVVDGYFVHYFLPPSDLPPLPLDIVFVLDISGSMMGEKIEQLKSAMTIILEDLKPDDRFNILLFDNDVTVWRDSLQEASESNLQRAESYVSEISAQGSTDLHKALTRGLHMLQAEGAGFRVPMVFFLTDGEPTSGIQDPALIVDTVTRLNKQGDSQSMANIYSLAFGSGADYKLLKQISAKNNGFARKIYADSDAALQVTGLYKEIATVVLRGLSISYHSSSSDESGNTPRVDNDTVTVCTFPTMFAQSDAVVAGKLENIDLVQLGDDDFGLKLVVTGQGENGNEISLVLNADDLTDLTLSGNGQNPFWSPPRDLAKITERAWAYLTIQQLLEQKVAAEENKELTKELDAKILDLSLKYHFVTPLTSMVVTRPEDSLKKDKDASVTKTSFIDDDVAKDHPSPPRMQASVMPGAAGPFRKYASSSTRRSWRPSSSVQGVPSLQHHSQDENYRGRFVLHSFGAPLQSLPHYDMDDFMPPVTATFAPPAVPPTADSRWLFKQSRRHQKKSKVSGRGHLHKQKKKKNKAKKCAGNKKVILESVSVHGTHVPEICAQLKSKRTTKEYMLLQKKTGDAALTVGMTSKFLKEIIVRSEAAVISVNVADNGSLVYASDSASVPVTFNSQSNLTVTTSSYEVTFSIAKQRCQATFIRIEVNLGHRDVSEIGDLEGVLGDLLQEKHPAAGKSSVRSRRQKRGKKARRKRKVKVAKFCMKRGIPTDRSSFLTHRQMKRHLVP